MTTATPETRERIREELDVARDAWETFREAYQALHRSLRHSGDPAMAFEAERISAYQPGGDPGYDWGMGNSADEWLDEIERVVEGRQDDEEANR